MRVVVPLASSMLLAAGALAQSPPPQQPPQVPGPALPPVQQAPVQPAPMPQNPVPQAAAPPPAPANPGLIEEFGKLLQNSASGLSSTWKGSQQTIDAIGSGAQGAVSGAAKGATDALISTTSQTMTKGRVACPMAGNGAPDCRAAAEQLCKTKGYRSGASLDIETAETCNAKVYISGRTGAPGECITRNFVTRAVCQ
ncbi:MAG TPA: hypothetical protein VGC86_06960 [Afipia sp.]